MHTHREEDPAEIIRATTDEIERLDALTKRAQTHLGIDAVLLILVMGLLLFPVFNTGELSIPYAIFLGLMGVITVILFARLVRLSWVRSSRIKTMTERLRQVRKSNTL